MVSPITRYTQSIWRNKTFPAHRVSRTVLIPSLFLCTFVFQHQAGDFDIPSYGHQEVDRFGVLMDAWTHEAAFLECKREVSQTVDSIVGSEMFKKIVKIITKIVMMM